MNMSDDDLHNTDTKEPNYSNGNHANNNKNVLAAIQL